MSTLLRLPWLRIFLILAFSAPARAGVLVPTQVEKLTPATGMGFGSDVSADGTVAAVASTGVAGLNTTRGRTVSIYRKGTGSAWNLVKTLRSNDFTREFGMSVSISGDLLAVGTPYRRDYVTSSFGAYPGIAGQVRVYRRTGSGASEDWVEEETLELSFATAPSDTVARMFGGRVRISGDMLAVSTGGDKGYGRIWLYRRTGVGVWAAGPQISPPPAGDIVAGTFSPWAGAFELEGNFLAAGPHVPEGGGSQIIIYERNTGGTNAWGAYQTISPPPNFGTARHGFADAMALSGNRLAVRANRIYSASHLGVDGTQGVIIYDRSGTAGSLFTQTWHLADSGEPPVSIFTDAPARPIALEGDILMLASEQSETAGTRVVLKVYAKTAATWDTATRRTLFAGYVRHTYDWFPVALTSGAVAFAGGDWSTGGEPHQRGVVEYFTGVGAGPVGALRLTLTRPPEAGSGLLGSALFVADDGRDIVAGDSGDDETLTDSGAVSAWRRLTGTAGEEWYPTVFIKPPVSYTDGGFGTAVAADDTTDDIIIGAPDETSGGTVYVYDRTSGELTTLPTAGTGLSANDRFGAALAQSGNFLAVGMPSDDTGSSNSGTVVMYRRTSAAAPWTFQKVLARPASIAAGDGWGATLDMDGDTLAVAAPYDDDADADTLDGSVAVLMRNQGGTDNWGLVTTMPIQPSDTTRGIFGYSLALRGDELVVGAWPFLIFALGRGEVFCFSRHAGGTNRWGQVRTLYQEAFGATPDFGVSVALTGDAKLAVVGMDNYDALAERRGHMRCFDRDLGGTRQWTVSSGDDPWQPTTEERFGRSVAAGADVIAVAAPADDTGGTDAGAIYVYRLGGYERWASEVGVSGARLMPPEGDWDNDGVTNFMEFGIGSNPRLGSSRTGGLTIVREGDGNMHVRLTKPTYDTGTLAWTVEGTRGVEYPAPLSLRGWSSWSTSGMTMVTDTAAGLHYHSTPFTSGGVTTHGIFVRLRVRFP